jgi:hypothetical protein
LRRDLALGAFTLLVLVAGASLALDASAAEKKAIDKGAPPLGPSGNASAQPAEPANVQGIWKIFLAGTEITMALNQSGGSLFGTCTFEGQEPWSGVVAGSISGRLVEIAVAALQGKMLVSTSLTGNVEADAIQGGYVSSNEKGAATKGQFNATRISADVKGYTPVARRSEPPAQPQPSAVQAKESPFKDVNILKSRINPTILLTSSPL